MIILGIDPGYATVGFGAVSYDNHSFSVLNYGAITTPAGMAFEKRLLEIYKDTKTLIEQIKPDAIAMEELFFNTNVTTGIKVSHARGVIALAIAESGLELNEYTPLQVKMSVVGYGRAEKAQVMEMVRNILKLKEIPRPDDAADALALAICHAHTFKNWSI